MRKLILLVFASVMLIGGLYAALSELLSPKITSYDVLFGGGIVALVGGYLIWTDFVAPRLGVKTWED